MSSGSAPIGKDKLEPLNNNLYISSLVYAAALSFALFISSTTTFFSLSNSVLSKREFVSISESVCIIFSK